MPAPLSPEQNEYARALLRELLQEFKAAKKTQSDLGELVGLDQSAISAITKAGATRGTSADVLIAAARLRHRPLTEVARKLGWPEEEIQGIPQNAFLVGAGAALLDGATTEDVEVVRGDGTWRRDLWTWSRIREEIMLAKRDRERGRAAPARELAAPAPPADASKEALREERRRQRDEFTRITDETLRALDGEDIRPLLDKPPPAAKPNVRQFPTRKRDPR